MLDISIFDENVPTIIEGLAKKLPAYKKWTDKYLSKNMGDIKGFVEQSSDSIFNPASPLSNSIIDDHMSPLEFVKKYSRNSRRKNKLFLAEYPLSGVLLEDILIEDFVSCIYRYTSNVIIEPLLYLGRGGNNTPMHYDDYSNIYIVLAGEKKVEIISSKYNNQLEKYVDQNHLTVKDIPNINYKEYPEMKNVHISTFDVKAGDALYIPRNFWHRMTGGKDRNLAVSLWF